MGATVALTLLITLIWLLTHRYKGLAGDAELYAIQALARIQPQFAKDVFLQHVSQDQYTVFSPIYALFIRLIGLQNAGLTLTIVFKVWFLAAAWTVARRLSNSVTAFLATALLIIIPGNYGAYDVFHYLEDWLTARSFAEALIVTALACHFSGFRVAALVVGIGALFVHPLMALPGVVILVCLWLPISVSIGATSVGLAAVFGIASAASLWHSSIHLLEVMDPTWLEVVRERSQFLFLQLWTPNDWKQNLRPFLTLVMTVCAVQDPIIRKFGMSAIVVGGAGLVLGLISGLVGPVAILLQGQGWRWVWVTEFTSVLLLAPTALSLWRDEKCGPLCVILLICGSTFATVDAEIGIVFALLLWSVRRHISDRLTRLMKWTAVAAVAVIIISIVANSFTIVVGAPAESGREPAFVTLVRNLLGLDGFAPLLVWSFTYWIQAGRTTLEITTICVVLLIAVKLVVPGALNDIGRSGKVAALAEFADWRAVIPGGSNVFVAPLPYTATFAWLSLQRPSYLSLDQSSGVVFSRETAMEIRRRAEVVLPVWDTNWRVLSYMKNDRQASDSTASGRLSRPLTKEALIELCRDPLLNYVVAKENVGFDPVRHSQAGNWKNWNLYDCEHVDIVVPSA